MCIHYNNPKIDRLLCAWNGSPAPHPLELLQQAAKLSVKFQDPIFAKLDRPSDTPSIKLSQAATVPIVDRNAGITVIAISLRPTAEQRRQPGPQHRSVHPALPAACRRRLILTGHLRRSSTRAILPARSFSFGNSPSKYRAMDPDTGTRQAAGTRNLKPMSNSYCSGLNWSCWPNRCPKSPARSRRAKVVLQ